MKIKIRIIGINFIVLESFSLILCIRKRQIEERFSNTALFKSQESEGEISKRDEKMAGKPQGGKRGNIIETTRRKYFEKEGGGRSYRTKKFC